jgi:chromosome partitioning protein
MGAWNRYPASDVGERFLETKSTQTWQILAPRSSRSSGRLSLCIANQKGGVGKTTTTLNLGAALAQIGRRVLVVDVDPQANATTGLGLDHRVQPRSTYDLLLQEAALDDVVVSTAISGLWCAPASVDLAGAEIELVNELAREQKLKEALSGASDRFEVVLVDCPPSLGLLTINAMVAARDLLVPVQCEYYALEGLGQLVGNAERVRKSLNPDLRIAGVLLTMYDVRTKLSPEVADEVRKHFGSVVYQTVIPRSIRLSEAPSFGQPAVTLDPGSRGARSYLALAHEIIRESASETAPLAEVSPTEVPASEPPPREKVAVPGPGGRGYGVATPIPTGIQDAWPPLEPWTGGGTR